MVRVVFEYVKKRHHEAEDRISEKTNVNLLKLENKEEMVFGFVRLFYLALLWQSKLTEHCLGTRVDTRTLAGPL